tara:strand:- start:117 stop:593 length:477 start_codon:yes stop_codon:yes gene_type:complete
MRYAFRRPWGAVPALLIVVMTVFLWRPAAALEPVFAPGGIAIKGADPVAYFVDGKPRIGSEQYSHDWNGAKWLFVSAENRDKFAANPESYAPQFGGYCAYAVGNGYTAKIESDAWTIVDNKLYLNYNKAVRLLWTARQSHYISEATKNWPKILDGSLG